MRVENYFSITSKSKTKDGYLEGNRQMTGKWMLPGQMTEPLLMTLGCNAFSPEGPILS